MQVTKRAKRDANIVVGGRRDLTRWKRWVHKRNRRAVKQAIHKGKDPHDAERLVTGRDVS